VREYTRRSSNTRYTPVSVTTPDQYGLDVPVVKLLLLLQASSSGLQGGDHAWGYRDYRR
jgi:hypothetical protein